MSTRVHELLANGIGELRYEPTAKRVRATLGGATAVDSTRAVLVWEPRRVVPSYAVPAADIHGKLVPSAAPTTDGELAAGSLLPEVFARPVLDPSVPFSAHTTEGEAVDVHANGETSLGAGLRLVDPDLAGYVVLDFPAFDGWSEEDEPIVGHPRDPFHRIDVLASSRHIRVELDGQVLAESSRPMLLFETMLPVRYYLPREDVRAELVPSDTHTYCAYKGQASYWSARAGGLVAFFNERVDVVLDGQRSERPVTPWSPGPRS